MEEKKNGQKNTNEEMSEGKKKGENEEVEEKMYNDLDRGKRDRKRRMEEWKRK